MDDTSGWAELKGVPTTDPAELATDKGAVQR
jgi:hypothetical protein